MNQDFHLLPGGNVPNAALVRIIEFTGVDAIRNGEPIPIKSFDDKDVPILTGNGREHKVLVG